MKRAVLFLLILALVFPVISACSSEEKEISIYFKDAQLNALNTEKRKIEKDMSATDIAIFAVNEFIKGPADDKNEALISKNAKLLNLEIVDGVATVNLSKHYSDEILLRQALVYTLCSIEGIDSVVIQVEGKTITNGNGKEIGRLSMNDYTDPENAQKEAIKLYFPNGEGMLESEIREVEIQNITSLEKAVVSELINGPSDKSLSLSIPTGTKLVSIETKDGVCVVNFSSEFISNTSSSTLETTLRLYSVVNSLCELENVESVQILINGEVNAEMGDIVFDTTYYADKSYIK